MPAAPEWAREFLERRLRDEARWVAASRGWHDAFMRKACDGITVTESKPGINWAEIPTTWPMSCPGFAPCRQMERYGQMPVSR